MSKRFIIGTCHIDESNSASSFVRTCRRSFLDLLDPHSPAPLVEEIAVVEHQSITIDALLELTQLQPGIRVVHRTPTRRSAGEKCRTIPRLACSGEEYRDFTPVHFVANHIEIRRA